MACSDLKTLSRRPLSDFPWSAGSLSPLNDRSARNWLTERFGFAAHSKAAAPVTCGVAIEVPLKIPKLLLGRVLKMPTPGAPSITERAPKLENAARASF